MPACIKSYLVVAPWGERFNSSPKILFSCWNKMIACMLREGLKKFVISSWGFPGRIGAPKKAWKWLSREGQLTWRVSLGCGVPSTGRSFASPKFPLVQDRQLESFLLIFAEVRQESKREGFESYQQPDIKTGVRIHCRCSLNIPSSSPPLSIIFNDTTWNND